MTAVFISHSSQYRQFVEGTIVLPLRAASIDVWYGQSDIQTAEEWEQAILRGLNNCDLFLLAMSPASLQSPWVKAEIHWAVANRLGRILPVLLESCDSQGFHLMMSQLQHLDLRQESFAPYGSTLHTQGTRRLIEAITKLRTRDLSSDKRVEPKAGDRWISPIDGQSMVWVPPGQLEMGAPPGEIDSDCKRHSVTISAGYWLDEIPVTNRAFARFVAANPHWGKQLGVRKYLSIWRGDMPHASQLDRPVLWINWHAARAYCVWADKRLPSEAEWEYAARAGTNTFYWWGDHEESEHFAGPVGSPKTRNPWGIADMLTRTLEWTNSLSKSYPYRADDGREDIRSTDYRVLRGGYHFSAHINYLYGAHHRMSARPSDVYGGFFFASQNFGFRCARSVY